MSYEEFCNLISGIMHDTPLGQIVSIRAEKDSEVIKKFTKEQKRIRNEWLLRKAKKRRENPEEYKKYLIQFQQTMKNMCK